MPHLRSVDAQKRRQSQRRQYIPLVARFSSVRCVQTPMTDDRSKFKSEFIRAESSKFVLQTDFEAVMKYHAELQAHAVNQLTVLLQNLQSNMLKLHEATAQSVALVRFRMERLEPSILVTGAPNSAVSSCMDSDVSWMLANPSCQSQCKKYSFLNVGRQKIGPKSASQSTDVQVDCAPGTDQVQSVTSMPQDVWEKLRGLAIFSDSRSKTVHSEILQKFRHAVGQASGPLGCSDPVRWLFDAGHHEDATNLNDAWDKYKSL
eukprot:TRINITY_DN5370_c0_g1_i1.p1 TRINITY_DN5370_c0_g1~~TRINITY_DN5370_c0_g1_i1.p1  ORF type:complete len:261 (+),score=37.94 TRINITY_DN5370_c0_g1_i1:145-927(+)